MKRLLGNLRLVAALSGVVIAACVLTLTVRVVAFGLPVSVEQQKVYDKEDISKRVRDVLSARNLLGGASSVECPAKVTVKSGVTFVCSVERNGKTTPVDVEVTDTDSSAIEVARVIP